MSAYATNNSTDFLFEGKPLWTGTIGSGGVTDGTVTTIPLDAATSLTNGRSYIFSMDRVDASGAKKPVADKEICIGDLSGTNFINCQRGVEGTAQQHNAGAVVEILMTATHWNKMIDFLGVEHKKAGTHGDSTHDSVTLNGTASPTPTTAGKMQYDSSGKVVKYGNGTTTKTLVSTDDTQTLTNKTIDASLNTLTNLPGSSANLYQNAIINGSCVVAQRSAPNISTSYQYGQVDRFAAKASGTAVSAGTITQTTSANAGTSGFGLKLAGVTVTGTGIVYVRYRMESKDAKQFKSKATSFACKVYHDVGSAVNYTIYVRKANAADDFSAVTDIANSGAISVSSASATTISFANINSGNIGDVSNGIEIEIQAACGAVTTKNFEFTEFIFNQGATAGTFYPRAVEAEVRACQRYCEASWYPNSSQVNSEGSQIANTAGYIQVRCKVPKRTNLTTSNTTVYNGTTANQLRNTNTGGTKNVTFTGNAVSSNPCFALFYQSATFTVDDYYDYNFLVDVEL